MYPALPRRLLVCRSSSSGEGDSSSSGSSSTETSVDVPVTPPPVPEPVPASEPDRVVEIPSTQMDLGSAIGSTSSRAGLGYLEEDSAGQQNIFSVEPKVYVQGSATDEARGGGSLIYSAVALAASGALVYIGLGALGGDSPTESIPRGKQLSVFLKEFGEETNTPYFGMPEAVKAAPAPAVVEEVAATEE
ncbi:hypothetical protein NFJ02_45g112620 [Pycnococcus provasolii]